MVGYSGNDELLDEIAKFGNFDSDLYWIGYKKDEPIDKVKEKLLNQSAKNAFLVRGYDADSFFLSLHSELKLETPQLFNKPFSFVKSMLENIKDIQENNSGDEHKDKFKNVKERLENSKTMLQEAIDTIENKAENTLEQEILEAIAKKDFTKADEFYAKIQNSNLINTKVSLSSLYNNWGSTISDLAELNADKKLFVKSFEKFRIATSLNSKFDLAFNNWGIAISELAKLKEDENLFKESFEKYKIATAIKPKIDLAFYNWTNALIHLFHLNKDKSTLKQALEKATIAYELNNKNTYNLACCYALLNDKTEAFKYLEESLKNKQITSKDVSEDKDWDKYRNDAEFIRLIEMY